MVSTLTPPTDTDTQQLTTPATDDVAVMRRTLTEEPKGQIEALWGHYGLAAAAVLCWVFLLTAFALDHLTGTPQGVIVALYVLSYLAGGTLAAREAVTDLIHGHINVDLLMITAAIGAAIVNAWGEGAALLALFSSSNALEHAALDRTRRAVRSLMELSPALATVVRDGVEEQVPVEAVRVGDLVRIRPAERVPVDGEVVEGDSEVDQASITGESVPVGKRRGDQVFAGTLNGTGSLLVRVTKLAGESTLARIVRVVEEAREQKSRTQRFAEAFEGRYAVGVLVFTALVFLIPWLLMDREIGDSFYKAMTLLVVLSPCALVISTPASTLSALANAARHGILFKGGGYLEAAGAIRTVAFDKTGTLTMGAPTVTDIVPLIGWDEQELLRLAASAEQRSEHHLAEAIVAAAAERGISLSQPSEFHAVTGKGIQTDVEGRRLTIGTIDLLRETGATLDGVPEVMEQLQRLGKTVMLVGEDGTVRGVIAVADAVRPTARDVIAQLHAAGVTRTVMLTGDNVHVARAIAAEVGIDDVRADLLPEEKLEIIRDLRKEGPVAMVGDGVNDAPALATADLGIAMGGAATDVALETADVVLMADDLSLLPYAVRLSRRTRRTIMQNLSFALGVIAVLSVAALVIGIPLPLGVVGHEGSTAIVVLNGLRLLRSSD